MYRCDDEGIPKIVQNIILGYAGAHIARPTYIVRTFKNSFHTVDYEDVFSNMPENLLVTDQAFSDVEDYFLKRVWK